VSDRSPRPLSILGAPSSAGAYGPGQERAPEAFRRHGLVAALAGAGVTVADRGDGPHREWRRDHEHPTAANRDIVHDVADDLARRVRTELARDRDVLVLGGDCTIEIGTVAGALADSDGVGLVYVDLDADLTTPATSDGILDWMGVAHLLGVEGVEPTLASLAGRRPMLQPAAVRLMATQNITEPEQRLIDELGLHHDSAERVTTRLADVLEDTRTWARAFDRVLVHVDADVLDYTQFPIAENTDLRGGLTLDTLGELLRGLCALPNLRALTLCEINPGHAPDEAASFRRIIDVLATALAARTA